MNYDQQEFNNIYYHFTKNKKGIRPHDLLKIRGDELHEFVDFAIRRFLRDHNNQINT